MVQRQLVWMSMAQCNPARGSLGGEAYVMWAPWGKLSQFGGGGELNHLWGKLSSLGGKLSSLGPPPLDETLPAVQIGACGLHMYHIGHLNRGVLPNLPCIQAWERGGRFGDWMT